MKWLEVRVSKEESDKVEEVLVATQLPYNRHSTDTESGPSILFSCPVPDEMIDQLVTNVSNRIDARIKQNMLVVRDVAATISPYLKKIEDNARKQSAPKNILEEISGRLDKSLRFSWVMTVMTLLATLVALAGLFLNNVAVIVGAMLLSPLIGPINAVSFNASIGRVRNLVRGELLLFAMLGASIGVAAVVTFTFSRFVQLPVTSEILLRTRISLLDLVVALILGLAAGLAITSDLPEVLVGVAVAVALVPPMAVTGIEIAFGSVAFLDALLVTTTNLFGLELGSMVVLLLTGISPRRYREKAQARKFGLYASLILLTIILILALLILYVPKGP